MPTTLPDDFHPALRTLLEGELARGNAIREVTRGFPKPASILVRLQEPFREKPLSLPAGVTYAPVNDPHWWTDEFRAGDPPHLLVG